MLTATESLNGTEEVVTPARTAAQIEASRANGTKGGRPPRKLQRKVPVVSGLLSERSAPLPSVREEDKTYKGLLEGFIEDFNPQTQTEMLLVEALTAHWLRYSRLLELRETHMDSGPASYTSDINHFISQEQSNCVLKRELDFLQPIHDAVRDGRPVSAWAPSAFIDAFIENCGKDSTDTIEYMQELEDEMKAQPGKAESLKQTTENMQSKLKAEMTAQPDKAESLNQIIEDMQSEYEAEMKAQLDKAESLKQTIERMRSEYEHLVALGLKGADSWRARFNGGKGSNERDQELWLEVLATEIEGRKVTIRGNERALTKKPEKLRAAHATYLLGQLVGLDQIAEFERQAMEAIERTMRQLWRLQKRRR